MRSRSEKIILIADQNLVQVLSTRLQEIRTVKVRGNSFAYRGGGRLIRDVEVVRRILRFFLRGHVTLLKNVPSSLIVPFLGP